MNFNGTGLAVIGAALDFIAGTQTEPWGGRDTETRDIEWAWRMALMGSPAAAPDRASALHGDRPRLVVGTIHRFSREDEESG